MRHKGRYSAISSLLLPATNQANWCMIRVYAHSNINNNGQDVESCNGIPSANALLSLQTLMFQLRHIH